MNLVVQVNASLNHVAIFDTSRQSAPGNAFQKSRLQMANRMGGSPSKTMAVGSRESYMGPRNYLNDFDDQISEVYGNARENPSRRSMSGVSHSRMGGIQGQRARIGMGARQNLFDIRFDEVRQEKDRATKVMNLRNILNDDIDVSLEVPRSNYKRFTGVNEMTPYGGVNQTIGLSSNFKDVSRRTDFVSRQHGGTQLNWGTLTNQPKSQMMGGGMAAMGNYGLEEEELPVMNNERLEKFSNKFQSDSFEVIEQKCFFLFAGSDLQHNSAFALELSFKMPDNPKKSKTAMVDIKIDNLTVEQCSDVIVSLTKIVPDFKTVLRYDDLFNKPASVNLEKKIRYQSALYYLRN
mmetsp:Transcript_8327/g.13925  ORF Transcript_8327/g.13925 Transcript_8327/m.13925 type:complete len:349 (-) Transcript_8327:1193-2239(-)